VVTIQFNKFRSLYSNNGYSQFFTGGVYGFCRTVCTTDFMVGKESTPKAPVRISVDFFKQININSHILPHIF
jgi:hypothetical protein